MPFQQFQGGAHRHAQLRMAPLGPVQRRPQRLDVHLDAVVLHAPPVQLEPRRVHRHGDLRPVREPVPPGHPDHPAPGAHAHHRADALEFERSGDHVAVGGGHLVGDRDHRPARGVAGVRDGLGVAGQVPAHDGAGQLLYDQLGDVAARIAPYVHDQRGHRHLPAHIAVELRPARAAHVGDVQIAASAFAQLPYDGAPFGDPVLVAQRPLVDQRDDGHPARRAVAFRRDEGQLDGGAPGRRQQRIRARHRIDRPAVHMGERGALADARTGQRGTGLGVGGLTRQDPLDDPPPVAGIEIGPQQPDRPLVVRRPLVPARPRHIRMRGAQLPQHLAQQIGELVGGGDPFDQRTVLRQHRVPVDTAHPRLPEVRPDQPARLVERLAPLPPRLDVVQDPPQVEEDRRVGIGQFGRRYGPQIALVVDDQPGAVTAERERVQGAGQFAAPGLDQVEVLQGGPPRHIGGVGEGLPQRPGDRPAHPHQPAPGDRLQRGVLGGGDRERRHPVLQPLHLHRHRPFPQRRILRRVQPARRRPPLRGQREGGGGGRGQRDQMRTAAQGEGQIPGVYVIDRVEAAPREEREVAPVPGEHRLLVLEAPVGDVHDRSVGQPGHLDLPQRTADPRMRPGQPAGVGGEGQIADRPVAGGDQLGDLPGRAGFLGVLGRLDVHQQQPPVVRGHRHLLPVRGRDQLVHPPQLPHRQPQRRMGGAGPRQIADLKRIVALGVRHIGDPPGRAQHLRQPDPDPRHIVDRPRGPVTVREPVQAAAHPHRTGPPGGVHRQGGHMRGGRYLVRPPAGPRPAQLHRQFARPGPRAQIVDQPEVACALVDDAGAVGGGMPRVEVGVIAVPPQITAVRQAGVDIRDPLVVGQERDPAGHEHHRVQMPAHIRHQPRALEPHPPHRTAPVALPRGRFVRRLPAEQQRFVLPVDIRDRDVGDRPPGQPATGTAVRRQAVRPGVVRERLPVRRDGQDVRCAVVVRRRPSAHPGIRTAPVRQPPRRAALDRREMDLRVEAAPGGEGDVPPVGREAGMPDAGPVHGQPPGPARLLARSRERRHPQVVLGGEAEQIPVQMRKPQVGAGGPRGRFLGRRHGRLRLRFRGRGRRRFRFPPLVRTPGRFDGLVCVAHGSMVSAREEGGNSAGRRGALAAGRWGGGAAQRPGPGTGRWRAKNPCTRCRTRGTETAGSIAPTSAFRSSAGISPAPCNCGASAP